MNTCQGGQCVNKDGTYECNCPEGYIFNRASSTCEDLDECDSFPCRFGTCVNTAGSFTCECPAGTTFDQSIFACLGKLCYLGYVIEVQNVVVKLVCTLLGVQNYKNI